MVRLFGWYQVLILIHRNIGIGGAEFPFPPEEVHSDVSHRMGATSRFDPDSESSFSTWRKGDVVPSVGELGLPPIYPDVGAIEVVVASSAVADIEGYGDGHTVFSDPGTFHASGGFVDAISFERRPDLSFVSRCR